MNPSLPADYLARDLDLGYAATAHRAQGATVDTAHVLLTEADSRESLYVAASRARHRTTLYAVTEHDDTELPGPGPLDGRRLLEQVIRRDADHASVIETIRRTQRLTRVNASASEKEAPPVRHGIQLG